MIERFKQHAGKMRRHQSDESDGTTKCCCYCRQSACDEDYRSCQSADFDPAVNGIKITDSKHIQPFTVKKQDNDKHCCRCER